MKLRSPATALLAASLAASLSAGALLTGATGAPAGAATGAAPVTVPDAVTLTTTQHREVDVLANDSDADGDALEVCRLGEVPAGLAVELWGSDEQRRVYIVAGEVGTYTVTYYACDFAHLTPGTLTVTVTEAPPVRVRVRKLAQRPGRLLVVNRTGFPVRFAWGAADIDEPEGRRSVRRRAVVTVRHRTIHWIAQSRRAGTFQTGTVAGIALP